MSNHFDWRFDDSAAETGERPASNAPFWWTADSFWFLLVAVVIVGLLMSGWHLGQRQLAQAEEKLRQQVQFILDLERAAFLAGDGELFFSFQANDPAWLSAQLRPENQAAVRAGLKVTRVEQRDTYVWANVAWTADGETWQRVAFFQWQENHLLHVPTDPAYWGEGPRQLRQYDWGQLVFYQVDEAWTEGIAAFVADVVAEVCAHECLAEHLPFTLVLTNDISQTAEPGYLHLPSPRLLALTETGEPAALFWRQLRQQIEVQLTPAVIRFAVPPQLKQVVEYEQAAAAFTAAHPAITVEIVSLESLPEDPLSALQGFDGAAVTPTAAMVAAGLVYDLTDFAHSDPNFNQADFYQQIWPAAWWQGRMWFVPQAARLRLLFYDKAAYQRAGRPFPSLRWTWQEMAQDVVALAFGREGDEQPSWGFLDVGNDSLFAYAYNEDDCEVAISGSCRPLQAQNITAALAWYRQMAGQPGHMANLTSLLPSERDHVMINWQSARRRAAIWVDEPVTYEYHLLAAPMGVVPFPGSDRFDGVTPLWVEGNFISQHSERPLAVWQWLKFLSYQRPAPRFRLAPARSSVADQTHYWASLPRPLGEAMRTAFPFARPVLLEEQAYFSWELLAAMLSGELTPAEAAQRRPRISWFSGSQEK
jgi:ABC-type glycerol-3-phosphate transport system substrate-binding protein